MSQPLNKSSRSLVLDLINAANNLTFTEDDFTWAQPVAVTGRADGRNTALEMTVVPTETLVGSQTVFYNRLDLSQLFNGIDLVFEDVPELVTTGDIIALLNDQFELALDATDIVIEPLVREGDAPFVNTLKTQTGSYAYIGQVTFHVGSAPVLAPGTPVLNGFFFVNTTDGKIGAAIESLTDVEDPELPLTTSTFDSYPSPMAMVSGGYENEIFGLVTVSTGTNKWGLELHYSKDGGQTWGLQPLLDNARFDSYISRQAVFFKGRCYFTADVDMGNYGNKVFRIVPDTEGAYPYKTEIVLEGRSIYNLVADKDRLFANANIGGLHVATNGTDWVHEASPLDSPDYGACQMNGEHFAVGYDIDGDVAIQRRSTDGTYAVFKMTFADRVMSYFDYNALFSVDNTLFFVATDQSEIGGVGQYLSGNVYKSTDRGETWTVLYPDTGMRVTSPPADTGDLVYVVGLVDPNGDTGNYTSRMMASADRGATWTFYDATSFPFLTDASANAMAVARQTLTGPMPAETVLPAPLPNLVEDNPFQASYEARIISIAPDDRILLGGTANATVPLTQVNGQAIITNFGLLDADGVLIDASGMGLTNVFNGAFAADNKLYVAAGQGSSVHDNGLLRFNVDLSVDGTFTAPTINRALNHNYAALQDIFPLADGKVIISGCFDQINGTARRYVARLNSDGTLDTTFNSPITGVNTGWGDKRRVFPLPSGRIIIADAFSGDIILADSNGAVIRTIADSRVLDVFELSNGDLWVISSFPTNASLTDGKLFKWLNDGTIVTDLPVNTMGTYFLFDDGTDRPLIQDFTFVNNQPIQKFYYLETDGNATPVTWRFSSTRAFTKLARQSTGAYVGICNIGMECFNDAYPRYNPRYRNCVARFYPNTEDLPAG